MQNHVSREALTPRAGQAGDAHGAAWRPDWPAVHPALIERASEPYRGDDPTPLARSMKSSAPHVMDGPDEGIGGHYKGLSGSVWQWVDTSLYTRCDPDDPMKYSACKVLKGGSWLESNPANQRAATRRYEHPTTADEDSGFRCARTVSAWPDADVWLSRLH